MGSHVVLIQGDRLMGSQKKKRKKKEKRARSLDEWILSRQKDKFFFTKLTTQNIEEFCFVSIVKRGHLLLPNFWLMFSQIFRKKSKNSEKQRKSKKYFFIYICIVFSIFSIVSKEFKFSKFFFERVRLLTRYF